MRSVVVLIPIDTYEQSSVDEAVHTGFQLLGGVEQFFNPEEKILLKPNLLGKAPPQRAVTTHPSVFSAVAKELMKSGCTYLTFGDSPSPASTPEAAAKASGISEAAAALNIPWGDFSVGQNVEFPDGVVCHSFHFAKGVCDADAIVNLCKMKTHALERITGAVKNMYGCILGLSKGAGHVAYPDSNRFAEMLTDIHRCVKPRIHIMDGIVAMEGNGPNAGTPIPMNVLLFSADPVALDTIFSKLVYLDPALVPTNVYGQNYNIGTMQEDEITLLTPSGELSIADAQQKYGKADFQVFRGEIKKSLLLKLITIIPFLQDRPIVDASKCIACGLCEKACPVPEKAVHSGNGNKAVYDYQKCIRCYCCQEVCPAKAISKRNNPLVKNG